MNDRMRLGMAEATRLTRAGRFTDATALIQHTLQSLLAPAATPDCNGRATVGAADALPSRAASAPAAPLVALSAERSAAGSVDSGAEQDETLFSASAALSRAAPPHQPAGVIPPARGASASAFSRLAPGGPWNRVGRAPATGGQFIEGAYTNRAGTRAYKLYLPSGYCGQALPLVVMLHGCTQDPDDFAAGTRMNELAEQNRFLVVYPAQAPAANPSQCWNWFQTAHQQAERGEPSLLAGVTRRLLSAYAVDARQVYVAGLSAGGAMAVILGESYPELYAAVGVHSGLAYGAAHDLPSALVAMRQGRSSAAARHHRGPAAGPRARMVPTIVFHGDRDATVHPCNSDQILADGARRYAGGGPDSIAGTKLRVTVSRGQTPGGRAYTRAWYQDSGGRTVLERWLVHEAGHHWSGGSPRGMFTDPEGPDASRAMIRFFYQHAHCEP